MLKEMTRLYRIKNSDSKLKAATLNNAHNNSQVSLPDCLFRCAEWYCEIEMNNSVAFRRVLRV